MMNKEEKIQIHHPNGMNYTTCYKPLLCGGESKPISEVVRMDNMQFMAAFPDNFFDLAVVDPEYGIGISSNPFRQKQAKKDWDAKPPSEAYFKELFRVSKEQIVWGGNYFDLPPTQGFIIWDKMQPYDFSSAMCEFAWSSIQKPAKIYRKHVVTAEKNKIHPTQKPKQLYKFCLKLWGGKGKILDTHLGSQSSRIAAWEMGFDFYGCEIDKDYFEDGCNRFTNETKQLSLWVG